MASAVYPKWKQAYWEGNTPDLTDEASNPIKLLLLDDNIYTYSSSHEFRDDITGTPIATSGAWTSVAGSDGVLTGTCPTFSSVASGDTVQSAVLFQDTGTPGTSRLIAYFDDLNYATNGADISVTVPATLISE